jgi:hypothetical protein
MHSPAHAAVSVVLPSFVQWQRRWMAPLGELQKLNYIITYITSFIYIYIYKVTYGKTENLHQISAHESYLLTNIPPFSWHKTAESRCLRYKIWQTAK